MTDVLDVRAIVRELLEEHGSNDLVVAAIEVQCEENAAVLQAVVGERLHSIVTDLVQQVVSRDRATAVRKSGLQGSVDLTAWAAAVREGLMDTFRLPGGKLLADATKPDLVAGANAYETSIGDMVIKSKWLRLLAKDMPDDVKTVRAVMTEDKVKALKDEARQIPAAA